jgi:putative ABC transport system permease protein
VIAALRRLRALVRWRRGAQGERDLDEELRAHLDLLEAEHLQAGMDPQEARRRALIELGGIAQVKEEVRAARPGSWLEPFGLDLRFAARLLRKSPGFAAAAVLTLALGVGSISTLLSIVYGGMWRPETPREPSWVAIIASDSDRKLESYRFSAPEVRDLLEQTRPFAAIGLVYGTAMTLHAAEFPEHVGGAQISASVIPMLGVQPMLGRNFSPEEDRPGGPRVAIITAELWETAFARSPAILGKAIRIDGQDHTVIGVMPPRYPLWGAKVYLPLQLDLAGANRGDRRVWVTAILRDGVSEREADASLELVSRRWREEHGAAHPEYVKQRLLTRNVMRWVRAGVTPAIGALLAAVGLLLLICSANLSGLLLARGSARHRELALRLALGASRGRLVRQLLTESTLLALLGGGLGILLSLAGIPLALSLIPYDYVGGRQWIRLEPLAVAVSLGISLLVGFAAGLAPAWNVRGESLATMIKQPVPRRRGALGNSARQTLIIAEVTIAVVLLASAALVLRSYRLLMGLDLGFHPERLITMAADLPEATHPAAREVAAFHRALLARLQGLPGVDGAALTTGRPMVDRITDRTRQDFNVVGHALPPGQPGPSADVTLVTSDYFKVMAIPLLSGRTFSDADDETGTPLAVVNATLAREQWPGADPIGQRIRLGNLTSSRTSTAESQAGLELVVVGVVADTRQLRYIEVPVGPQLFLPILQRPAQARSVTLLLRSGAEVGSIARAARAAMLAVDPSQAIHAVATMDELVVDAFGPRRLTSALLSFFALLALTLVVVGLHALLAFEVAQRRPEIGLRLAVGASPGDVLRLFVGRGIRLALAGCALGTLVVLAAAQVLQRLVYQVSPHDPTTLAGILALVLLVAVVSCLVPARRAMRIDPMIALRCE